MPAPTITRTRYPPVNLPSAASGVLLRLVLGVMLLGRVASGLPGPGPGGGEMWGKAEGKLNIPLRVWAGEPRQSTLDRSLVVPRGYDLEDQGPTTTFVTVATTSARRTRRASGPAKVANLAVHANTAPTSDQSQKTDNTTKQSGPKTKSTSSTRHTALNQIATSAVTTSSATPTTTSSSASAASSAVPSSYTIPRAFDSTLGTNFTSTACPSFFATFLADPDFIACSPFSLLLATSSAFFKAQQSPTSLLPFVMDATCAANQTTCEAVMDTYAARIQGAGTCGPDLVKRNPLVVQALSGFQNYRMMYQAGCLKDPQTEQYCFAEAAAATTASELYFWYLPEGTGLPSGTQTSCGPCTQDLMAIYASYATNASLMVSDTYASARTVAVSDCGPTFAQYVAQASAGTRSVMATPSWVLILALVSLGWLAVG